MNPSKNWLIILATFNLIVLLIFWIVFIAFTDFIFTLTARWHYFIMLFSSVSAYLKRIELATVLQLIGCFLLGTNSFLQTGIAMAFNSLNFWELLESSPFHALELFSFFGFCVIAIGLLILEYRKYNAKKHQNIIS